MSNNDNVGTLETPTDRGAVVEKKGRNLKGNIYLLLIPLACVVLFAIVIAINILNARNNDTGKKKRLDVTKLSKTQDQASTTSLLATQKSIRQQLEDDKKDQLEAIKKEQANKPLEQPVAMQSQQNVQNGEKKLTPEQRKQLDGVLVSFDTGNSTNRQNDNQENNPNRLRGIGNQSNVATNSFNSELQGSNFANGFAYKRRNLDYLLIHGTNIPCVLKTKIITNFKSLPICIVSRDIYSANGKVLLIERGSQIAGEQRSAITQGHARAFISWSTVETPYGISLTIDSLGTDTLGASGASAWVDSHIKERFGGAVMLTLLDGVIQYAENKASESSKNGFTFNNTSSGSNIAEKALENSINIEPTGYINQGTLLNVLVSRDIDMQSIYEVR